MARRKRSANGTPSVRHVTLVTECRYLASCRDVFRAWADPSAYFDWHIPGEGWAVVESVRDFSVGGRDFSRFGPPGNACHHSDGKFQFIAPHRLIVTAGTMFCDGAATSSTLCSIEIIEAGGGARVIVTDQSAYYNPLASEAERARGWREILAKLGHFLGSARADA